MKKILMSVFLLIITSQAGICSLSNKEINVFNIKENNMYILETDFTVKNINVFNEDIVNIIPITTISNDKKQLFLTADKSGVCDVILKTDTDVYQLRFISGSVFEDNRTDLIQIDIPSTNKIGIK